MEISIKNKEGEVVTTYLNDLYYQKVKELKRRALYYETTHSFVEILIQTKERLLKQYNHSQSLYTKEVSPNDSAQIALRAFNDAWDQVRLCIDQEMSQ